MKITLSKSEFLDKLIPCMGTVSNKNTITSIEGVLIETVSDGQIRISTYDMSKGIRALIPAISVEEQGSYIINAQRLLSTVRVLPEDEFTIEVNEQLNCNICSGKASFSMFAMKGEDFPSLPDLSTETGFDICSDVFRRMIGKVLHSVAEQDNRPMLCGAFFHITSGHLEVVSCDSYTLSRCETDCEIGKIGMEHPEMKFILPGHALIEMMKILPDDKNLRCSVYLSRKHAILCCEDTTFFTRIIDSDYIDYERIIPKENNIILKIDRERFLSALERANLIAEEKIQGSGRNYVLIRTEDQVLTVSSSSVNGKVYDEIDCVHEGSDIEIAFNCRYLINSIKASEGECITLTLKSTTTPITIEPGEETEGSSFFYMILPVRMATVS